MSRKAYRKSLNVHLGFLFCFLLGLILLAIYMGISAYPLLGDDSSCFIPVAIQWKKGLGLTNPVDIHTHWTDWSGQARFLYYPPLFQYTLALVMPTATASGAMIGLGVLDSLGLVGTFLLLLKQSRYLTQAPTRQAITIALSLMGLLTYVLTGTNGRPEVLVLIWVSLLGLIILGYRQQSARWLIPLLLGLLAATHPVGALYSTCLILLDDCQHFPIRRVLTQTAANIAGALAVYLFIIWLSPYTLPEHLKAMSLHAKHVVLNHESFHLAEFIHLYFTGAHYTGYGLLLFAALLGLSYQISKIRISRANKILSLIVLALLWAGLLYLTFRVPARNYNVFCFMPLVYAANLWGLQQAEQLSKPALRNFVVNIPVVLAGLTCIGFIRKALLFFLFLHQGVSLNQARLDYANLIKDAKGTIAVSDSMWMLSEQYGLMRYWADKTKPPPQDTQLIILQNNIFPDTLNHTIPGYHRVFSSITPKPATILGFKLANSIPGYGFVAFQPDRQP